MDMRKTKAIGYAFLAAVFYAINVPVSKLLLQAVGPVTMAALLYLVLTWLSSLLLKWLGKKLDMPVRGIPSSN